MLVLNFFFASVFEFSYSFKKMEEKISSKRITRCIPLRVKFVDNLTQVFEDIAKSIVKNLRPNE